MTIIMPPGARTNSGIMVLKSGVMVFQSGVMVFWRFIGGVMVLWCKGFLEPLFTLEDTPPGWGGVQTEIRRFKRFLRKIRRFKRNGNSPPQAGNFEYIIA